MANDMAACWECKKPIGVTAAICPHCGADQSKNPEHTKKGCIGCLIVLAVVGMFSVMMWISDALRPVDGIKHPEKLVGTASIEEKSAMAAELTELINAGIVKDVSFNPGDQFAEAFVTKAFVALPDSRKSEIVESCYRYAFGLPSDVERFKWPLLVQLQPGEEHIGTVDMWKRGMEWK